MSAANLFSLVSGLSGVTRFSGVPLVHKENVLEHTATVVILALWLGSQVNRLKGNAVSIGNVLQRATVHDFDETITGDVPRPVKYFSADIRMEFAKLERHGIDNIASLLALPTLAHLHMDAKGPGCAGFIVAFADVMAAVHRVWEEVLCFRNNHMVRPAAGMRGVMANVMMRLMTDVPEEAHEFFVDLHHELLAILNKAIDAGSENRIVELHHAH